MSGAPLVLSVWLHGLATVVLIGYFLVLSLVYLPYLRTQLSDLEIGTVLDGVTQRVRPWLWASLLVFVVTGAFLMFGNANYLGVGRFGNTWSVLMLVKHALVLAIVGLWVWLGMALKRERIVGAKDLRAHFEGLRRIGLIVNATSACGALVLLLTAAAQVA